MADRGDADIVHPEDQQLVEKLAKLQNMYKQVSAAPLMVPRVLLALCRWQDADLVWRLLGFAPCCPRS